MKGLLIAIYLLFLSSFANAQLIEGKQTEGVLAPSNYIKNALAEKAEKADEIVDLSNILEVVANTKVDPYEGNKSFRINSTSAAQMIKFKTDGILPVLFGQNCMATFSYKGDASLYKVYIERDSIKLLFTEQQLKNTGTSSYTPFINFPCGNALSETNLVIESTGDGAAIKVDKLYLGEATNITNQVVVTDWQDYTVSSIGGLTGFTVEKAQWRRIGDSLSIQATVASGTTSATTFNWPLPSGMNINTAKTSTASTNANSFGFLYHISGSSANQFPTSGGGGPYALHMDSAVSTNLLFAARGTASARFQKDNADNLVAPGSRFRIEVDNIPIAGWSATQSAITQQCIQDGSCENTFSAYITSAGVVSEESGIDWIDGNCTSTSPYTCNFKSGFFSTAPHCSVDPVSGTTGVGSFNAITTSTQVFPRTKNGGTGAAENHNFYLSCRRSTTDYKPRFAAPVLVGSVTSNSQSAIRFEYASIATDNTVTNPTTPGWISCIGTTTKTCTFSQAFTSTPVCIATPTTNGYWLDRSSVGPGSVQYNGYGTGASSATVGMDIVCFGPR